MSILVVLEYQGTKWAGVSFEALTAAQKLTKDLNEPVELAVLGGGIGDIAKQAAAYDVTKVYALDHALLAAYTPDGYTAALQQLIQVAAPRLVLFPHTYQVRDFAPKLATRMGSVLISDVVDTKVEGGQPILVRQIFQGKLRADVRPATPAPWFASIQASNYEQAEPTGASAPVENFTLSLDASQIRSKPEAPFREAARTVDLTAANIIVAVGRGIKEQDNIPMVQELATLLGAELAASRPICDAGWLPLERQVGSSGQTVSPKMYIAVGISGAVQHLVGMKGAKSVLAINKDEEAPIFETADYCVIGDLMEIVPQLISEIKKAKG